MKVDGEVSRATRRAIEELIDSERGGAALYDVVAVHLGTDELTRLQEGLVDAEVRRVLRTLRRASSVPK